MRPHSVGRDPRKDLASCLGSPSTAGDPLDDIDLDILRALQEDGRLTLRALGSRVNLSDAPVQRRLRTLERNGWIRRYVALVDPVLARRDFTVFMSVELDPETAAGREAAERRLRELPEVVECHRVTGSAGYLLKVVASDAGSFDDVNVEIMELPGFRRATRHVSLAQVKHTTALPLPDRARDL